jgi:hypothetical protein
LSFRNSQTPKIKGGAKSKTDFQNKGVWGFGFRFRKTRKNKGGENEK